MGILSLVVILHLVHADRVGSQVQRRLAFSNMVDTSVVYFPGGRTVFSVSLQARSRVIADYQLASSVAPEDTAANL